MRYTSLMRTEARGRAAQVNSDDGLDGLETAASQSQLEKIGTLSFPVRVCKDKACPIKAGPIYENTHRIEEIIRRRSPALLLCAGWSVPARDLQSISALTEQVKTVVVLARTSTTELLAENKSQWENKSSVKARKPAPKIYAAWKQPCPSAPSLFWSGRSFSSSVERSPSWAADRHESVSARVFRRI